MKVSTFHNLKFIANAVTMGLYNESAVAAILDICKLANFHTQTGQTTKEGSEKKLRKSDEY